MYVESEEKHVEDRQSYLHVVSVIETENCMMIGCNGGVNMHYNLPTYYDSSISLMNSGANLVSLSTNDSHTHLRTGSIVR